MKEPLIIISEGDVVGNKGAVAMVFCIVKGIREKFPGSRFIITSKFIKQTKILENGKIETLYDNEQAFDIPLIKAWIWWLFKNFRLNLNFLLNDKVLKIYSSADLVVSASGISFHDNFGFVKIYHFSKYIQIPFFLNKKVIKFTQSIGPFNTYYNKLMAKLVLKRTNSIFARGKNSLENLKKIGIDKNVEVFPDIAVSMEAKISDAASVVINKYNSKNIIGISPNIVIEKLDKKDNYISSLKSLVDHILKSNENSVILLIPHTIEKSNLNKEDDYSICSTLLQKVSAESRCEIVNTLDYSPEEVKWLISKCCFFVGSRFHSLIASTSSCVPSIAVGWHWKYEEMMEWFNLEGNTIQYWDLTSEKLLTLFDENFQKRELIRNDLNKLIPALKEKATGAIDLLCKELNETN